MNIRTFVVIDKNDNDIESYSFSVVLYHNDGKIVQLGDYQVDKNDKVVGLLNPFLPSDPSIHTRVKKVMLDSGLAEVVGDAISLDNYFGKSVTSFSPEVSLTGSFQRAAKLVQEGKCEVISQDKYNQMLLNSETLDDIPEYDVQVYDGIYGSDEFDYEAYVYSDLEDASEDWNRRR